MHLSVHHGRLRKRPCQQPEQNGGWRHIHEQVGELCPIHSSVASSVTYAIDLGLCSDSFDLGLLLLSLRRGPLPSGLPTAPRLTAAPACVPLCKLCPNPSLACWSCCISANPEASYYTPTFTLSSRHSRVYASSC